MNLRMLSLKQLKLVEISIAGSSLSHSIMVDGKKVFPKKLYLMFNKGVSIPNVTNSITRGNNFE